MSSSDSVIKNITQDKGTETDGGAIFRQDSLGSHI